jgi:biotin synthase
MGAAWRGVRDGSDKFQRVLNIVREVSQLGMEVCVTLGEIGPTEARKLKAAGVTAYNHNIDTSPEFYSEIVSTHTFQDRLDTIAAVQESGMSVCCGGIIGLGESENDRLRMLEVLSNFDPPPESVPINCLMAMPGTPLADQPVIFFELVRLIAVTRIALPKARVRLAAGTRTSREGQALCFRRREFNYGDKLLTAKILQPISMLRFARAGYRLKAMMCLFSPRLREPSRRTFFRSDRPWPVAFLRQNF